MSRFKFVTIFRFYNYGLKFEIIVFGFFIQIIDLNANIR